MTADEFERYLSETLGLRVERLSDSGGVSYTVVRDLEIPSGGLRGRRCDVAMACSTQTPYVVASAIQTRPPLIAMGTRNTQASPLGGEWQYWSRRYDHAVTPQLVWAHVLSILCEDDLVPE
jgi:hypothetical protein